MNTINLKNMLVLSMLIMSVSACGNADGQYKQDIVGSWQQNEVLETGVILEKIFTFYPDGNFLVSAKRVEGSKTTSYQTKGIWKIEKGELHFTTVRSTHPNIPSGYESTNKIIKITKETAVSENLQGKVTTAYRVTPRSD